MKKRDIENKLNLLISNSIPNVLDNILAQCEKKKGFEKESLMKSKVKKEENNKKIFMPKLAMLALIIMVCFGSVLGYSQYDNFYKVDSIINFDVNPSIELDVNKKGKIIKVNPLNEEGKLILDNMDFEKVDLDVAVNAIIGSMLKNGYITVAENSILVSVKNNDIKKANQIKKDITDKINELLSASSIDAAILSQAYDKDTSTTLGISEGKAKLINDILATGLKDSKGNAYTFESLSKLSINELNILLTAKEAELKDVQTTGTVNESAYIGKDSAKRIAFEDAGVSESKVKRFKIEFDCDDGRLVYEIEFNVGNKEYEYEVHAKTGDILDKEIDVNDD